MLRDLLDGSESLMIFPHEVQMHFLLRKLDDQGQINVDYYKKRSQALWEPIDGFDTAHYTSQFDKSTAPTESLDFKEIVHRDLEAILDALNPGHSNRNVTPKTLPSMWGMKEVGGDTRKP